MIDMLQEVHRHDLLQLHLQSKKPLVPPYSVEFHPLCPAPAQKSKPFHATHAVTQSTPHVFSQEPPYSPANDLTSPRLSGYSPPIHRFHELMAQQYVTYRHRQVTL